MKKKKITKSKKEETLMAKKKGRKKKKQNHLRIITNLYIVNQFYLEIRGNKNGYDYGKN